MSKIKKHKVVKLVITATAIIFCFGIGYLVGDLSRKLYTNYKDNSQASKTSTESVVALEQGTTNQSGPETISIEGETFNIPSQDANDIEKGEFSQKMMEKAVEAKTATIADCKLNPGVMKVNSGMSFSVENKGSEKSTLRVAEFETTIESGKSTKIDLKGYEAGLYGLSCDGLKMAGMIFIVE